MTAAWVVFDELPNAAEATGGALLLAGVATVALAGRRTRAAAAPDPVPVDNVAHD